MNNNPNTKKLPGVKLKPNPYQSNRAELNTDLSVRFTFDKPIESLIIL